MTNLTDTPPEIEQLHIALFQNATVAKHINLLRSFSQMVVELSRCAIREAHKNDNELEIRLSFIALHYDAALAISMQERLKSPSSRVGLLPPSPLETAHKTFALRRLSLS